MIKVVLVFFISNFFTNKNFQGRKSVREKNYLLLQIRLYSADESMYALIVCRTTVCSV